jgi:hypothetical protein
MGARPNSAQILAQNLQRLRSAVKIKYKELDEQNKLGATTINRLLRGDKFFRSDTLDALAESNVLGLASWILICEKWEIIDLEGEQYLFIPKTLMKLVKANDGRTRALEPSAHHQPPKSVDKKKRPLKLKKLVVERGAAQPSDPDLGPSSPTLEAKVHVENRTAPATLRKAGSRPRKLLPRKPAKRA